MYSILRRWSGLRMKTCAALNGLPAVTVPVTVPRPCSSPPACAVTVLPRELNTPYAPTSRAIAIAIVATDRLLIDRGFILDISIICLPEIAVWLRQRELSQ